VGSVGWTIAQIAIESSAESLDYKTQLVFAIAVIAEFRRDNFAECSKIVSAIARKYSTSVSDIARVATFFGNFISCNHLF